MSILLGFECDAVADYVLTLPSLEKMREHIESFSGARTNRSQCSPLALVPQFGVGPSVGANTKASTFAR